VSLTILVLSCRRLRYLERTLGKGDLKMKKRAFELRHSENDPDYVAVVFPPDLEFASDPSESALRIFPIDSSYWVDYLCDRDHLIKFFQYLQAKDYAFAFLLGPATGSASSCSTTRRLRRSVTKASTWRLVASSVTWAS
jgi:hypothetical protein